MNSIMKKHDNKEIWCTIGPSSLNDCTLERLEELGVSLLRINLSHTKLKDINDIIKFIQSRTSVPICLDTEGAQIRTGDLSDDEFFLHENRIVYVHDHPVFCDSGNISFYPEGVIDLIMVDDFISIDFNSVLAQVIAKDTDRLTLRVLTGGTIKGNKAVSVVNREITLPVLTDKDREALRIGVELGIRHVALSFASCGSDVNEIRRLLTDETMVTSKIESINGVEHLKEIAAKSDALLLDRGDLSRQVSIEQIPALQKEIVNYARKSGVKIYVATNLLESMVTAPTPTRAEVNDVFNTLNDGADGLVLAAETAIGSYPVHCVKMISKIIQQYQNFSHVSFLKDSRRKDSFILVEPHGGVLIDRVKHHIDMEEIAKYTSIEVDITTLLSAEQIALGTFSPLDGFMNKREVDSVLKDYHLPDGVVWPLPIILQVPEETVNKVKTGDTIGLKIKNTEDIYALLYLEEIYTYDLNKLSMDMFGTTDRGHPGVRLLKKRGEYFLGGSIDLIKRLPSEYKSYELTPRQVRTIFENKGWSKVVGFHTRNVIHRAHEHIQMAALKECNGDGLFVHPVIGPKKEGDFNAGIILKSYELMLNNYYPEGKVLLSAFQNYSRYSGPREAVFTALCRKNFGCSHFIVGRDHTGVGNYYKPDDAERLFKTIGDIGITPIFFDNLYYCKLCRTYVEHCKHNGQSILNISGTEGRQLLKSQQRPPDWFMREDISNLILAEIRSGKDVFAG